MKQKQPKQYFGLPSLKKLSGLNVRMHDDYISGYTYFSGYKDEEDGVTVVVRVPHKSFVLVPELAEIIPKEVVLGDEIAILAHKKRKSLRRE